MADSDLTRDEILGTNFEYTQAGSLAPEDTVSGPWAGGDEITADKLNQFDKGISDAYVGIIAVADNLSTMSTQVNQIQYVVNSEENNGGLAAQVSRLDSEITLLKDDDTKSGSIAKSIKDAVDPVKERLNAIDGTIPTTLKSRVDDIESKYVSKDGLTTQIEKNAFIKEIENAHRTGNELSSPANNYEDSLDSRFDDIEAVLRSKNNNSKGANLNARFIALEAAIETITGSDVDSGSLTALAARITVLENALKSALDSDEDNVWDTLEDYLHDLEEDVADLKTEIGQFDGSRIDTLETAISHEIGASGNDDKGGLTQRIGENESAISALQHTISHTASENDNGGLVQQVADLDTRVSAADTKASNANTTASSADAKANSALTSAGQALGKVQNLTAIIGGNYTSTDTVAKAIDSKANQSVVSGLGSRLDKIDGGNALTGDRILADRVSDLENNPTSLTVVIDKSAITYNNDGVPTSIGEDPSVDKDYLLQGTDDKYYYWKYIKTGSNPDTFSWQLISGAGGGTGNNNAEFVDNLPVDDNISTETDYYMYNNTTDAYEHYRYINGAFRLIGGYSNTQIDNFISQLDADDKRYDVTYETVIDETTNQEKNMFTLYETNKDGTGSRIIKQFEIAGGSGVINTINITNLVRPMVVSNGKDAIFSFTATTSDESDISSIKWYVNDVEIQPGAGVEISPSEGYGVSGTTFSFNAKGFLRNSSRNTVRVELTSESKAFLSRSWPIQSNEFSISWNRTIQPIMLYTTGEDVNALINVVAAAGTTNRIEVKVNDNEEYAKTINVTASDTITVKLNANWFVLGENTITAQMFSNDNVDEKTDKISYTALWGYNATTPTLAFADTTIEGQQYEENLINYYAYNPTNETTTVTLSFSDGTQRTSVVGREMQTYRYTSNVVGQVTVELSTTYMVDESEQTVSDHLTINISKSAYNLGIVSGDSLQYNFDPSGHSNTDIDHASFANITLNDSFDWINGGFQQDNSGTTAFVIKKGDNITLPRSLFTDDDSNGKTIDICFKITNSDIYDATAFRDIDSSNSPKGLVLKANHGELYLNNSAPQVFKYCEENRIDMSIHIEGVTSQRLVTVWLDGIPSYAGEYAANMLKQSTTGTLTSIGSNNCDIWIYNIRVYSQALSERNMVQNYIANGATTADKIKRSVESDIYSGNVVHVYADASQTEEYYSHQVITPEKLHAAMPDLTIVEIEADRMTKTKSDPVPAKITITDRVQVKEGNTTSYRDQVIELSPASAATAKDGCLFKVQGTSSVAYARSALNIDIDFKNCKDEQNQSIKYKISPNAIGVNYINIKANVASSENANNVCAVDWYNTYQPFKIVARENNAAIRDSVEAKPCAVFFTNTSNTTMWLSSQKLEPGEQTLYFMGDLCNSKKNTAVFGQNGEGEHYTKCCIEDSGNDTPEQRFLVPPVFNEDNDQWDTYSGQDDQGKAIYTKHFEWRMEPSADDRTECIDAWTETATWVTTTINDPVKFKNEFDQYFVTDAMLYHFLMIEYFAAYDNVSKNTFYSFDWDENADQSKWGGYRWSINKAYDWDTILAYDNDGKPLGDYGVDFGDTENGKSLFNAATNPIWVNIQSAYKTELNALYSRLRGEGTWNSNNIAQKWDNYQSRRPHATMVRDAYIKYIYPYKTNGVILDAKPLGYDNNYIGRLAGSKTYQRRQYLTYQTSYMDGKYGYYNQNDALQFRTNGAAGEKSFTVKSYAKTYMTLIKDGQSQGSKKVGTGAEVTFDNITVGNNTTMYLTPNQLVQYIQPLNETQNSTFGASGASKLTEVVLGGEEVNRSWLTTSNIVIPSPILKTLDIHNIETFVNSLDLSANVELTTLDTRNTGTGIITIAPYAPLTNLHLNACSGLRLNHITTIPAATNFTLESGENLSFIMVEDCNYTIMSTIIEHLSETLNNHDASQLNIRLTGLHGENESSALELSSVELLEKLARANAIDSYGNIGTAPCVLTGKVHVPEIGTVQLAKFRQLWPNLDISYDGEAVPEWTVRFVNANGVALTDFNNKPYIQIVRNKNSAYDPVVANEIPTPTKAADAQYSYTFSGWNNLTGLVESNRTVTATYTSTINSYVVRWFEEPGESPILSYTENYGTDITTYEQPEELGRITRVKETATGYKIFAGWDKPVGQLTKNLDIYAQWETSTINDDTSTIDMSTLSAADLYALSQLTNAKKRSLLESKLGREPIYITFGRDFNYTSEVNSYNLLGNQSQLIFDGTPEMVQIYDGENNSEIRPLSGNNDWTLAIDYKMVINSLAYFNSATEFVLASCYKNINNSIQGFKLSLIKTSTSSNEYGITVTWGTNTATIDYVTIDNDASLANQFMRSYRNMLVLRHSSSEPNTLFIYSSIPESSNSYHDGGISATVSVQRPSWENLAAIDTPLILGGNYSGDTTNLEINTRGNGRTLAQGRIYWAKYWDKDLGIKNCVALAQWPHKRVPFVLCGYTSDNMVPNRQIVEGSQLTFVALESVNDRYYYPPTGPNFGIDPTNNNKYLATWKVSAMNTLCNGRMYAGLPTAYQSIILQATIHSIGFHEDSSTSDVETTDYFYLPAEREITQERSTADVNLAYEVQSTWTSPWPWISTQTWKVLEFNEQSGSLQLVARTSAPCLYRFMDRHINANTKIFNTSINPYNNGNTWTYNSKQIMVQPGDIWINNNIAYIYYSAEELTEGIILDIPSLDANNTLQGGWKQAELWNLRTYSTLGQFNNESQFEKVDSKGALISSIGPTTYRSIGIALCPEFSI